VRDIFDYRVTERGKTLECPSIRTSGVLFEVRRRNRTSFRNCALTRAPRRLQRTWPSRIVLTLGLRRLEKASMALIAPNWTTLTSRQVRPNYTWRFLARGLGPVWFCFFAITAVFFLRICTLRGSFDIGWSVIPEVFILVVVAVDAELPVDSGWCNFRRTI
jgi:hypothetical protein